MGFGTFLLSLVTPLIGRILFSLGFSVVTIAGMTAVVTQVRDMFITQVNSMPADMLNLFLFAGGGVGFGMIMGAITTRITIWTIQNGTKILGKNPA